MPYLWLFYEHNWVMSIIGLLGGSFNPAHGGHRAISLRTINLLSLDAIWWMVSPGNPLKKSGDMANLPARLASAQHQSRRAPIKATAIEQLLRTRYTVHTVKKIQNKYPQHQFIWIMGADNLAQFHLWYRWKDIAKSIPIIVIERPGYNRAKNDSARFGPAMAYLRKYQMNKRLFRRDKLRKTPALMILRFRPDKRSASEIRLANPNWYDKYNQIYVKDAITHKIINQK